MRCHPVCAHHTITLLACCVLAAVACRSRGGFDPDSFDPPAVTGDMRGRVVLVDRVDSPSWPADPITINAITIDRDTLRVSVSHGGGCRPHAFQFISETAWMESYPVQVHSRISHFANSDLCRVLVSRVLHVDLSPLKQRYRQSYGPGPGRIALRLTGATDVPVYIF